MKKNERLIYTNANGDSLEISWYSPYTPTAFADELDNDVTTSKTVQQDGENYISGTLEARALSIDGFFLLAENNTLERRLKKVFNPKFTGKLVYTNGEEQRYLIVSVDHGVCQEKCVSYRVSTYQQFSKAAGFVWQNQHCSYLRMRNCILSSIASWLRTNAQLATGRSAHFLYSSTILK